MKKLTKDELLQAYKEDWYTVLGVGGDKQEWMDGYNELLEKDGIGHVDEFYFTTGKMVNDTFKIGKDDRFKPGLTIMLFPHNGLNVNKLAIFKIKMGDRWLRDVIDNTTYDDDEE